MKERIGYLFGIFLICRSRSPFHVLVLVEAFDATSLLAHNLGFEDSSSTLLVSRYKVKAQHRFLQNWHHGVLPIRKIEPLAGSICCSDGHGTKREHSSSTGTGKYPASIITQPQRR